MAYPDRAGHLRRTRPPWGQERCERHLAARKRRQKLLRVVKIPLRWLWRHWWFVLACLLILAFVLLGCPWVGTKAEAQAEVTSLSLDEAFLMGYRHGWQDAGLAGLGDGLPRFRGRVVRGVEIRGTFAVPE